MRWSLSCHHDLFHYLLNLFLSNFYYQIITHKLTWNLLFSIYFLLNLNTLERRFTSVRCPGPNPQQPKLNFLVDLNFLNYCIILIILITVQHLNQIFRYKINLYFLYLNYILINFHLKILCLGLLNEKRNLICHYL